MDQMSITNSSKTPKRAPLKSNHDEITVKGAVFSVVVTVTVTVTVAWLFPTAAFSFTGTPMGEYVMPAPSALDVDVLVTPASVSWGLSVLADGGVAEDCIAGVEISGEDCEAWGLGNEPCALFSLGGARSFWGAVTTANNAFGIEIVGVASAAVVSGPDVVASDLRDLFTGLELCTCWAVAVTVGTEGVGAISWLWMVACAEREEVTGCTGFGAMTLCVAWLRSPSACNICAGCEVTATGAVVEDDRPANILAVSPRTMHCTTTPVKPEGFGSARHDWPKGQLFTA